MATSKMKIKKVCEWCGITFYAQKLTTRFCSHRCNNLAYKEAVRQKRKQEVETKVQTTISEQPISDFKDKEYLSFKEVATLLGLSKQAIYKMVYSGKLQAFRISSRLSFIRKGDIDRMLEARPYKQRQPKDTIPITDFYTTAEVKEKYHVNESWIFVVAKKNNIPRTFNRGKTYWSKKHIDAYFAKKAPNPDISEWYSTQEMQEKFGMTLSAIYTFVSKNAVPKKKEGIMVYYSKKHVDIAKGVAAPEEPQYYTVAEAMEKFNLTRDQLYHYAKYHNIPKVKKGKYTLISKPELDKLLAAPKIE
ncbi:MULTISPECIES: helix-turn-helix domain-containing protein [Bacteroidales]|uniref:DNA-binding protein n=1 Tax=Parabacteroides distasonis TaxID=823 RepID=A0A3L7ZLX8_PARDI|nr:MULTISPECIES: helix-turn-helix domain-containing protein [Bacteroidales]NBH87718.1 DNA-binding protein [Parabacteroides distasonis]NVK94439.1 helix-turn-helix domain-containing protein [Bacteroides sp. L10-4]RLT71947.1 DNA-binding protein [Parabacteroides distasonis]